MFHSRRVSQWAALFEGCKGNAGHTKTHASGFRVQDSGFRVQGSGFRVQSSGVGGLPLGRDAGPNHPRQISACSRHPIRETERETERDKEKERERDETSFLTTLPSQSASLNVSNWPLQFHPKPLSSEFGIKKTFKARF